MKRILTLALIGIIPIILLGQVPKTINYQAVVKDAAGIVQSNVFVNFQFDILQNGAAIFTEYHNSVFIDTFGIVNLQIGTKNPQDFSLIDWSTGQYQLKVHLNGTIMGISDFASVPFALYAEKAASVEGDNDTDPTNEIQKLSYNPNTSILSLSGSTDSITISGLSKWGDNPEGIHYTEGKVGIGTDTPSEQLEVKNTLKISGANHYKLRLNSTASAYDNIIQSFDENNNQMWAINMGDRDEGDQFRIDRPWDGEYEFVIDTLGRVGIGTNSPQDELHLLGALRIKGINGHQKIRLHSSSSDLDNRITSYDENDQLMWQMLMGFRAAGDRFQIDRPGNGVIELYIDTDGMTHVSCLNIHGGCDIVEPFEMSAQKTYPEGSLVIIDSENVGKLTISHQAYDKRIAGVISGAGGINPGISLQQDGVLDNGQPVSLAGRVYVKASAVNGSIQPGDLLTTSDIPGYAMKATSKKKRQGAVIGKAMSELKEGEGLVLVLVNLL